MQVRLLTGIVGPTISLGPGDLLECDDAQAARMIAAGAAEAVEWGASTASAVEPPETASLEPPAQAIRRRGRPRKVRP